MAKVRSRFPSSTSSRSWLLSQKAGDAKKPGEAKADGQVSPKQPLSPRFISPQRTGPPPRPESTALNAVDLAVADGWVPRPRSLPRVQSGVITARQLTGAARLLRCSIRQPPPTLLRLPEVDA